MANRIRQNVGIKSIDFKGCSSILKLLQYADDTLFFVKDKLSLLNILNELDLFGNIAGPKLNKDKTVLFWIGDTS